MKTEETEIDLKQLLLFWVNCVIIKVNLQSVGV